MKPKTLRIATRQSPLALKQSEIVKTALEKFHPDLNIILVPLITQGDKLLEHSLSDIGGKGLFIKELERALLENEADIAVHSMKDMPVQITPELEIAAYLERDDPRDVFVSNQYASFSELPKSAKIGTASLRRQGMIKYHRPDLITETLRGNVNTRLSKLDNQQFDAIILAAAGLHRLGFSDRIKTYFSPEESIPAINQGIIGIQCRSFDIKIKKLLSPLDHYPTKICAMIEKKLNGLLEGDCHSPIGGYATIHQNLIHLRGCVYSLKEPQCLRAESLFSYDLQLLEKNISALVQKLIDKGAQTILHEV